MKPKIYVLIGNIASGKTTYCKNAAKKGFIIMNDDAIVNLLHADNYELYDQNLKVLYKSIENHIVSLAVCLGKTVVIDRGLNAAADSRKRWIALAKSFDVECGAIVFPKDTPEVHAKRRADSDGRGFAYNYWLEVAQRTDKRYSEPSIIDGFNTIDYITFESVKDGRVIID